MSAQWRVLHLRASPFVGGPERQILRCASFELGTDVEQAIASFEDETEGHALLDEARAQGLRTVALSPGSRQALSELKAFLRTENISLLCTHGYKADVLGILAARKQGIPVACFLRGWTSQDWKVRLYERLDRFMLRFATSVVGLSKSQIERLGVPITKRNLVTNVIESQEITACGTTVARATLRERFGLPPECMVIAAAGRLSPEKGTRYFLEAARDVTARFPNARFVVFGGGIGFSAYLKQFAGSPSIHFAGHVPDFRALLPGVDILVNPSLMEEMPNVVLEAMSCGVPVIATAVGGVPEIAGPERCLRLIAPGHSAAISEAITELLQYPDKAESLARCAKERIRVHYSPARQKHELTALYARLLPGFRLETQ